MALPFFATILHDDPDAPSTWWADGKLCGGRSCDANKADEATGAPDGGGPRVRAGRKDGRYQVYLDSVRDAATGACAQIAEHNALVEAGLLPVVFPWGRVTAEAVRQVVDNLYVGSPLRKELHGLLQPLWEAADGPYVTKARAEQMTAARRALRPSLPALAPFLHEDDGTHARLRDLLATAVFLGDTFTTTACLAAVEVVLTEKTMAPWCGLLSAVYIGANGKHVLTTTVDALSHAPTEALRRGGVGTVGETVARVLVPDVVWYPDEFARYCALRGYTAWVLGSLRAAFTAHGAGHLSQRGLVTVVVALLGEDALPSVLDVAATYAAQAKAGWYPAGLATKGPTVAAFRRRCLAHRPSTYGRGRLEAVAPLATLLLNAERLPRSPGATASPVAAETAARTPGRARATKRAAAGSLSFYLQAPSSKRARKLVSVARGPNGRVALTTTFCFPACCERATTAWRFAERHGAGRTYTPPPVGRFGAEHDGDALPPLVLSADRVVRYVGNLLREVVFGLRFMHMHEAQLLDVAADGLVPEIKVAEARRLRGVLRQKALALRQHGCARFEDLRRVPSLPDYLAQQRIPTFRAGVEFGDLSHLRHKDEEVRSFVAFGSRWDVVAHLANHAKAGCVLAVYLRRADATLADVREHLGPHAFLENREEISMAFSVRGCGAMLSTSLLDRSVGGRLSERTWGRQSGAIWGWDSFYVPDTAAPRETLPPGGVRFMVTLWPV